MAFPVPEHLPRAGPLAELHEGTSHHQISVAQSILRGFARPLPELTPSVARKCVDELERAIIDTKKQLNSNIEKNPSAFERQRQSAADVARQTAELSSSVNHLETILNDPKAGLLPTLIETLSAHKQTTQAYSEVFHRSRALVIFLSCYTKLEDISSKTRQGDLPAASQLCSNLSGLLSSADNEKLFAGSQLWSALTARYRATDDNIQEQLGKAYHNGVQLTFSGREATIRVEQSVKLPVWTKALELSSIISAMRDSTVHAIASSLRKDITAHAIEPILTSSALVSVEGQTLRITPESGELSSVLPSLERILDFLQSNLPPAIMSNLHLDMSSALLKHLIIPSLPQSLPALPPFLALLREAVQLEQKFGDVYDIKEWADDVGLYYERARRQALLDHARGIILDSTAGYFEVEEPTEGPNYMPEVQPPPPVIEDSADDESNWDFEDAKASVSKDTAASAASEEGEDDTWGFDDSEANESIKEDEPSEESGWGWDNDTKKDEGNEEEDDPWDLPKPVPKANGKTARGASKLEKRANRGRQPSVTSPPASSSHPKASTSAPSPANASAPARLQPQVAPPPGKQTYTVSQRARSILDVAGICLEESKLLLVHKDLPKRQPSTGTLLMSTPSAMFDLYRALPQEDVASPRYVIVSNDCKYLSKEVGKLAEGLTGHGDSAKFPDAVGKLETGSTRALIASVSQQIKRVGDALAPASGFVNTSNDAHAQRCHRAVENALSRCQNIANEWRSLLTFPTYARAIGAVVDGTLQNMMDAILQLPDITESESHRLSSLCVMMYGVEGLFVRAPGMNSEIALYVPSWFKFNYVSTLLEASMADFTEFFREGMLVDFDVQEIASLLRALFADTPMRAQTIDMVLAGHPGVDRA